MLIGLSYCPSCSLVLSVVIRTTTALVRVIEDLRFSMAEGWVTVLVLLDFSKAFDCVNYPKYRIWSQ
jgi:hypothetical protein